MYNKSVKPTSCLGGLLPPFYALKAIYLLTKPRSMNCNYFITQFLIILIAISIAQSCEKEPTPDLSKDAVDFKFEHDIHIGIVRASASYECTDTKILFDRVPIEADIRLISDTSRIHELEQFNLICLPLCWADLDSGSLEILESLAKYYNEYVNSGGNLLVEQPNPYKQPGDSISPSFLPYSITFHNSYNSNDYPPIAIDSTHPLTRTFRSQDLPFPADRVSYADERYQVLVQGRSTQSPSLLLAYYGSGRILINTSNSTNILGFEGREPPPSISGRFFNNMILWMLDHQIK